MAKQTELIIEDGQPTALAERPMSSLAASEPNDPMSLIRHMIDRGQMTGESAAAIAALVDCANKQEDRAASKTFAAALNAFQAEAPVVYKGRQTQSGPAFKYCSIEDVETVIAEPLNRHGFSYTFPEAVGTDNGMVRVVCELTHIDGHSRRAVTEVPIPKEMRVNATLQGVAAISFGKRLALCDALGIRVVSERQNQTHTSPEVMDRASQPISFKESVRLSELLEAVGGDRRRFFDWASKAAGRPIQQFDQLPQSLLSAATAMFEMKKPSQQQGGRA